MSSPQASGRPQAPRRAGAASRGSDLLSLGSFVVLGLPDGMLGTAWPSMRLTFGAPVGDLGLILLIATAGSVLATAFVGPLITRPGVPAVLTASGSCAALGATGFALAPGFWLVLSVAVLSGVAAGTMDALVALTPVRVGPRQARHVIAWQVGAAAAGGAGISALIGLLIGTASLAVLGPALTVLAVLVVAAELTLTRLAPSHPDPPQTGSAARPGPPPAPRPPAPPPDPEPRPPAPAPPPDPEPGQGQPPSDQPGRGPAADVVAVSGKGPPVTVDSYHPWAGSSYPRCRSARILLRHGQHAALWRYMYRPPLTG